MVTEDPPKLTTREGPESDGQEITPTTMVLGEDIANSDQVQRLDLQDEMETTVVIETNDGVLRKLEGINEEEDEGEDAPSPEEDDDSPKALDGGYGWVVCFGAFFNRMIYGGLIRSEGLLFLQFKSRFETSAQLAAWPGSLMSTLNLFMGPAVGAIVNRYSVRAAFIIGAFLCFTGMLLNGFAPSPYFLFFSHTLLGGIGRGLMSGILLLNLYFDKHRSLATGLGMSGVGIGSLWVVPLTQYLFDTYGFTGAFMILSGLTLNGMVVAMLYRPFSMTLRFIKAEQARRKRKEEATIKTEEGVALTAVNTGGSHTDKLQTDNKVSKTINFEDIINTKDENHHTNVSSNHFTGLTGEINKTESDTSKMAECHGDKKTKSSTSHVRKRKPDGFIKSSVKILFPVEHSRKKGGKKKKVFQWSLVKSLPFMTFVMSNFLFMLAFRTTLIFLPAIAMSKNLTDTEAALLLTITGAFDTFGRLAIGFVMDLRPLRPYRPGVFNILYFLIAALSLLVPTLNDFASYAVVCAGYGMLTGASIAQKVVVLVDIIGRDALPSSFGILKWFQGFGTLIGPPLAGALRDALGNYDVSFYVGGVSMFCSALLLSVSNVLIRLEKKKSEGRKEHESQDEKLGS